MFTASSSPSSRLPLHPVEHPLSGPSTAPDISSPQKTSLHYYGDDNVVRDLNLPRLSVPSSATIRPRSPRPNGPHPHRTAHFLTSPHNVSIDPTNPRPRTPSVPVPQQNLISHHGLPSSLPPPPRTTFYTPQEQSHPFLSNQDSEISNIASYLDTILRGSYSKMLSQKQEQPNADSAPAEPQVPTAPVEWTLDDMFKSDYLDPNYEEYLTSPLLQDETPEETPFLETPGEDAWTSPIIDPGDDSYGMGSMPLFGAVVKPADDKPPTPVHESLNVLDLFLSSPEQPFQDKIDAVTPSLVPLDSVNPPLYAMPSTPVVQPATLFNPNSSSNTSNSSSTVPARQTKPLPTGTRRNITPASLVPLDAPTQARQYATPSATSRKAVPAAFRGKKRGPEEDEEEIDGDAIEAKRRQNTLAARRSRQRKLQHVRELEDLVDRLTTDREQWMKRAYEAEAKLRAHGMS